MVLSETLIYLFGGIMSFKRARSEAQIQKRISEIVDAASLIYNQDGFEGLTFSKISELTQFTRPTIYKYFATKEEILLKMILADLSQWVEMLVKSFKVKKIYTIEEIADILSHTLTSTGRLVELLTFLFTSIEKNVSKEALIEFKMEMFSYQSDLFNLFSMFMPNASSVQIENFITSQLTLAIGLYPMCHLSDVQLEVVGQINPSYKIPEFEKTYRQSIFQVLYCLKNDISIE